jgi:ribosomal protein L11 methyltransferase
MSTLRPVTAVSADVPGDQLDALLDLLSASVFAATAYEDVLQGTSRVEIFLADSAEAPLAAAALVEAGGALGLSLHPATRVLPVQDWAESWKRFFHVERVSERVVVRPTWEPYTARPGECVIDLDPGMSFGTGQHGTTRACLRFLDRLSSVNARRSVLDMGCGSGILAIAAVKLGFAPVCAFDNDPDAVAIARENAALNGVAIAFETCDLAANTARADVVVANILAPVLVEAAVLITAAVRPGGVLVISGILDAQYAGVLAAFVRRGFAEHANVLIDEWRSGWLVRETR